MKGFDKDDEVPSVTKHTGETSSSDSDEELEEHIHSMIEGRLGVRPDLVQEFRQVAAIAITQSAFHEEMTKEAPDIGVLACGPMAMVKTINEICNTSPCFSRPHESEDGDTGTAFFAFSEDDWEW